MAKHSSHILELAKKGAFHRYQELKKELAELTKAFPHLEFGSAISPSVPRQTYKAPTKRKSMSAEARKAISAAQKARWAKQKSGAKK
jgi:hypothetical protein